MKTVVLKFGGTSVGSIDRIKKVCNYISDKKGGRPAKLFKFNAKKYRALEKSGFHFEIKIN